MQDSFFGLVLLRLLEKRKSVVQKSGLNVSAFPKNSFLQLCLIKIPSLVIKSAPNILRTLTYDEHKRIYGRVKLVFAYAGINRAEPERFS